MTQEEKARAYDEAIKKAAALYKASEPMSGCNVIIETLFPELAENKDERIMKALKQYFVNSFKNNGVAAICGVHVKDVLVWLEKQGQVKESEISQPIKETSKENNNSLTNKAWSEIQNGIILDGVVYELTTGFPDNKLSLCGNCELNEKCIDFDGSLCYFFADNYRKVFRKVKMERKL